MKINVHKPILHQKIIPSIIELESGYGDVPVVRELAIRENFREQDYRHITVLGRNIRKIEAAIYIQPDPETVIEKIRDTAEHLDWSFTLLDVYKIAQTGDFRDDGIIEHRLSYIRLIHMPAMEEYYAFLNDMLQLDLPTQYPHITLFTKGEQPNPPYFGIPIPSEEAFNSMSPEKIQI